MELNQTLEHDPATAGGGEIMRKTTSKMTSSKSASDKTASDKTTASKATRKTASKTDIEAMPYRPCVGLTVFNREGRVFIGRRSDGPEHTDATHVWQMPQGGIDEGEDAYAAALRELHEETNIRSVTRLGEISGWLSYDIPTHLVGRAWQGRYRGQRQRWFALLFIGEEREIDIRSPGGGQHKPEFIDWRWEPIDNIPQLVVPFKRAIYQRVVHDFRHYAVTGR